MKYILFPEGRILNNNGTYEYEYHLKDHLGSVRVAFVPTVNGKEVVQENAYYPFGGTIDDFSYNASENCYKHTGMESIDDFGLNMLDNNARWRDVSAVPRFYGIDPLAEKYYSISPYALWGNNPVKFIDPDGRKVKIIGDDAKKAVEELYKTSQLKIERDDETGQLSATGEAKTDYDKALLSAINDPDVITTLSTTNTNKTTKGKDLYIGAFEGSTTDESGKVNTLATINMGQVETASNFYGTTKGSYVAHEIIESFTAGKDSPNTPAPTTDPNSKGFKEYLSAHNKAMEIDPSYKAPTIIMTPDEKNVGLEKYMPEIKIVIGRILLYNK